MDELIKLTKVSPLAGYSLRVKFEGDRRSNDVDLTGLVTRSAHFTALARDPEAFAKVQVIEDGLGVTWPIKTKWGPLDLSASTLRRIAEEQRPMTGVEFAAWRNTLGLSLTEAANLLGLGRRTIMGYLKKDELPAVVAIACRALARDVNLFAAHYVPTRKAGRKAA